MSRAHGFVIAIAAVAAAAAACASFSSGAAAVEAPADAAAADSSLDASLPGREAGADAAARFCRDGGHAFCADFDDDGLPPWGFEGVAREGVDGGAPTRLELTPSSALSPPRSLLAHLLGGQVSAMVLKTLARSSTNVRFEFAFRIHQLPVGAPFVLFGGLGLTDARNLSVAYVAQGVALLVDDDVDGGAQTVHPLTLQPALDTWSRVRLDADLAAGRATVSLDGAVVVANVPGLVLRAGDDAFAINVGAYALSLPGDVEVQIDDVTVDQL